MGIFGWGRRSPETLDESIQTDEKVIKKNLLASEPQSPDSARVAYEAKLKQGEYLGILESYKVKWDLEKVARDTLQNFFDSNDGTLDNVSTEISPQTSDSGEQKFHLNIASSGEPYDWRKLVHLGGTSKETEQTAGGFGEGAKIAALVMLRDQGFESVKYGSGNWELNFYLDEAPQGSYDQAARGLYAKLTTKETAANTNSAELVCKDRSQLESFIEAKDLFYHSQNPDFQNPTYQSPNDGAKMGFKFLGLDQEGRLKKGHLYDAGQRRHYTSSVSIKTEGWDTVVGVNIWSLGQRCFEGDRDRGAVLAADVESNLIGPMLENADKDSLIQIVSDLEEIWSIDKAAYYDVCRKILDGTCEKLYKEGTILEFDEKYLSLPNFMPISVMEALRSARYIICAPSLSKIGMKDANQKFKEMQTHFKVEPTPEQNEKVNLLNAAVELMGKLPNKNKEIKNKEIWLYSSENEKSIIAGQYDENFIWLSEKTVNDNFDQSLATYLHELDHRHGNDYSATFSYALTDSMGVLIEAMRTYPQEFQQLADQWEKLKVSQK